MLKVGKRINRCNQHLQWTIITKHVSEINISKLSMRNRHPIIQRHVERGIHWSTNQTPHFLQLEFKFDPLKKIKIPSGVIILWTPHFHVRSHSTAWLAFFICLVKIWFLEKDLESPLILIFFKGKNKIRKKNPKCDSWRKNRFVENQSRVRRSGYLLRRYGGDP